MSDFGYTHLGKAAVYDPSVATWYDQDGHACPTSKVTPVQVVGPRQVAVDASVARNAATLLGRHGYCAVSGRLRAALAAADDLDARSSVDDQTSDRLAEPVPSGDQGETVAVDATDLRTLINRTGHDGLSRPEEHDAAMRARAALAAAEPAPDTEQGETCDPHVEGADEYGTPVPWGPKQGHTAVWEAKPQPAQGIFQTRPQPEPVEPQRVTLPDTPWTTVRANFENDGWRPFHTGIQPGVWLMEEPGEGVVDVPVELLARVVSYEVLAEPPKADTSDTFEQYQRELRHTQAIEDRAAKRGRDEALAEVATVARQIHAVFGYKGFDQFADTLSKRRRALAKRDQREAGGDGR